MRFLILTAALFLQCFVFAQKTGKAPKPKASVATKPVNKKAEKVSDNITAELIFSKVGKTKVTFSGIDLYSTPQLDRKKEIMYFLFERFNKKQIQRIVELSKHEDWSWDTLKACCSKLNPYLVKAVRYYWDTDRYDDVAFLYFPYSENIGADIPVSIHPATPEGAFLLVPYKYIVYDNKGTLVKWQEKSFDSLRNFTPDCADMIYNYTPPQPVAVAAPVEKKTTPTTTTTATVSKGLSKDQFISIINTAISYIKDVRKSLDNLNSHMYYYGKKIVDTRAVATNVAPCNEAMRKLSQHAVNTHDKAYDRTGLSPTQAVKFSNYDDKITEINQLMKTWTDRMDYQLDLILKYLKEHNGSEPSSLQYLDDGQTEYKLTKKMTEFVDYFQYLYSQ